MRPFAVRCAFFLGMVLAAGSAAAQDFDTPANPYARPHLWRAEVNLTTFYYPYNIDSGITATVYPNPISSTNIGTPVTLGPFSAVFGSRHRLLAEGEFARDLWQGFGSVGVGLGAAYAEFYGLGYHQDGSAYVKGTDGTGFHIAQAKLLGYYRFDYFVPDGVPIVPFIKGGIDWAVYWEELSSGEITPNQPSASSSGKALGMVTGVEASFGISILLDFIDPVVARDMYRDLYIAHTYLNAAYTIQNFQNGPSDLVHTLFEGGGSAPPALDLSTRYLNFGVSVEF